MDLRKFMDGVDSPLMLGAIIAARAARGDDLLRIMDDMIDVRKDILDRIKLLESSETEEDEFIDDIVDLSYELQHFESYIALFSKDSFSEMDYGPASR
jgi:hypothetical protein